MAHVREMHFKAKSKDKDANEKCFILLSIKGFHFSLSKSALFFSLFVLFLMIYDMNSGILD